MARQTTFTYRLPCAVVVISGTVRRVVDKDIGNKLAETPAILVDKSIEVRHQADDDEALTACAKGGWVFQYKASFARKEDGRLTSASSEATGVGTELVSAGATLAGFAMTAAPLVFAADDRDLEKKRRTNYADAHADVAAEREDLLMRRAATRTKVRELELDLVASPEDAARLAPQLEALRETEGLLAERVATLDAHYAAWLTTRRTTVDDSFEIVVPVEDLPSEPGDCATSYAGKALSAKNASGVPAEAADLWKRFGLAVLVHRTRAPQATADRPSTESTDQARVLAREAEPVVVSVLEHVGGRQVVASRSRHLVGGPSSPLHELKLKRTLFGRRSLSVSFSENGYLAGLGAEGGAALGEAAKALSGGPAALVGGIESGNKLAAGLTTARQAGLTAELARVKAEVDLGQQRVVAAGLDLTAGDAARLARLKQLKEILEAQAAIKGADPSLVAALKMSSADDLDGLPT